MFSVAPTVQNGKDDLQISAVMDQFATTAVSGKEGEHLRHSN
jgi:hypothetical protein